MFARRLCWSMSGYSSEKIRGKARGSQQQLGKGRAAAKLSRKQVLSEEAAILNAERRELDD
jgi:hypothetical protein